MENPSFGMLNYSVLFVYLAAMFGIGLWFSGKQKTTEDYFLAGRRMRWFIVAMSMCASMTSAISYMGLPARAVEENISMVVMGPVGILAAPFYIAIFYPIYRRLRITTTYDYIEARFGRLARFSSAGFFILARLGWIGTVLYAPALALSVVTGIDVTLAILLMGLLATAYTVLGGLAAVIWTDAVQFVILACGAVWILLTLVYQAPEGLAGILTTGREAGHWIDWQPSFFTMNGPAVAVMGFIAVFFSYGVDQVSVQRLMAISDPRGMARAAVMNSFYDLFFIGGLSLIGLGLLAYVRQFPEVLEQGISGDQLLPYYIMHTLPAGVSGLLITAIFAAAMSSMDSGINTLATVIINDFIRPLRKAVTSERQYVVMARQLTLVLGMVSVAAGIYASRIGHLFEVVAFFGGLFFTPVCALFLMGVLSRRANFPGWVVGTVVAVAATFWMRYAQFDLPISSEQRAGLPEAAETFRVEASGSGQRRIGQLRRAQVTSRSEVTYRLASAAAKEPFSIDPQTGLLQVRGSLDDRAKPFYVLQVEVDDHEDDGDTARVDTVVVRLTRRLHWSLYTPIPFTSCLVACAVASLLIRRPLAPRELTVWARTRDP